MTLEDRLSAHLKDTSAKLSGRPPHVDRVVSAAGARRALARLLLGGGVLAAGLAVLGVLGVLGVLALPRGEDPGPPTRVVVSPFTEAGSRQLYAADEVVFVVTTDTPAYWRIASLPHYEGGWWGISGDFDAPAPSIHEDETGGGDRQTIRQTVEIVNLDAIWLPAAAEPVQLTPDGGFRITVDQVTNAMTVPNDRPDSDGLRYSVVSSMAVPTPDQLRIADGLQITGRGTIDVEPDSVPAELQSRARELTTGLPTGYDKVMAILADLRSLTLVSGSERAPNGTDPAARLLQTGEGTNEDFASAMALLARAVGIPSRVAIGFTPGDRIDIPGDGTTSGQVTLEVSNHDAHAWTEIYFAGVGWVGFEPTPGYDMPLAERYTEAQSQDADIDPETCVAHGAASIGVPNLVGLTLADAVLRARQAGLRVVDSGVPSGDPTGADAVVSAQEPPAGTPAPEGSCIGFRTREQ